MASTAIVSLVLCHVALIACCARLPALEAGPPEPAVPLGRFSAASAIAAADALLEDSVKQEKKRTQQRRSRRRLPLLSAARVALLTSGLDASPGSWNFAQGFQVPIKLSEDLVAASAEQGLPLAAASSRDAGSSRAAGPGRALARTLGLSVRGGATAVEGRAEDEPASPGDDAARQDVRGSSGLGGSGGGRGPPYEDPSKLAARLRHRFGVTQRGEWEEEIEEFWDMVHDFGWVALTLSPRQLWRFEFFQMVHSDTRYVEVSFADVTDPYSKMGAVIVKLSPRVEFGRFRGFEGTQGRFRFRFLKQVDDLRLDIEHLSHGLATYDFPLFAVAAPRVLSEASLALGSNRELRENFHFNMERLAWPTIPRAAQLLEYAELPGYWRGEAELGGEGRKLEWRLHFRKAEYELYVYVETGGDFGEAKNLVPLQPLFVDDDFYGLFGTHTEASGLRAEYLFSVVLDTLLCQINHHMDEVVGGKLLLKFKVPFENLPEEA